MSDRSASLCQQAPSAGLGFRGATRAMYAYCRGYDGRFWSAYAAINWARYFR